MQFYSADAGSVQYKVIDLVISTYTVIELKHYNY